jgi:hypothetical protein
MVFAGTDWRAASSLDEVVMSQLLGQHVADALGEEPEGFWQTNVAAWCTHQLRHNRDPHAGIAEALLRRKRIKGRLLRELCSNVSELSWDEMVARVGDEG